MEGIKEVLNGEVINVIALSELKVIWVLRREKRKTVG